jgi:hypothetical protein
MFALPLNETPLMFLAVCNTVALAAFPEVEDEVVALPDKVAVIVPALKLPEASLDTIAFAVLALVALDVTVKELVPAWFAVNVAEPDNPLPLVDKDSVPLLGLGTAAQEELVPSVVKYSPELPVIEGSTLASSNDVIQAGSA